MDKMRIAKVNDNFFVYEWLKDAGYYFVLGSIYLMFRCFSFLPYFITKNLAVVIGAMWFLLDKRHRNMALTNLQASFGTEKSQKKLKKIAFTVFANTVHMVFEMAKAYRWPQEKVRKMITVRGLYHLKIAHQKGKGILLLTGHTGNWEMSVHLKTLTGIDGSGVYRKLDFPPLEQFILEKRKSTGCRMYALKESVFGIFYELNQGNFVGLLVDQNAKRSQGVFVDFFGRPACANKGLAQLALNTGAPVIPYFFRRENKAFILEFGPEVKTVVTGDKVSDIIANTQNYNRIIENFIRKYPDQWLWIHNRWKNQPCS